jgi:hypothetical protein
MPLPQQDVWKQVASYQLDVTKLVFMNVIPSVTKLQHMPEEVNALVLRMSEACK